MTEREMIRLAIEEGFAGMAVVDTKDIVFDDSFRTCCEENLCGQYGVNYTCPPACGTAAEMRERIMAHKHALVLQTIWEISDYSDMPAIKAGKSSHNAGTIRLAKRLRAADCPGFLVGASGCALCTPCACAKGEPCRFPEYAYSCMSAYCIFVKKLADHCGLEYNCGEGLLAFFGMYVFD